VDVPEYAVPLHLARVRHSRDRSIEAGGETWRRLKVTFPDDIKSHIRQQISCFGPDGLLRRHDFTFDVLGGHPGSCMPPATATPTASSSHHATGVRR
jgi:hypothetical protein